MHPSHFFFVIVLLLLGHSSPSRALTLPVEQVGAYLLQHNPQLRAARWRVEEARGRLQQAGRLSNLEFTAAYQQNMRTPEYTGEITFSQRFPLTGRLRHEKSVSRAELAAAEAEVRDESRRLAGTAQILAVRLVANAAQAGLRQRELRTSEELVSFTRRRLETAEASEGDVAQVELEAGTLSLEILALTTERNLLLTELRPLLGVEPATPLEIAGELSAPPASRPRAELQQRPDLEAARARIFAAEASVQLSQAQRWEDVGLGITAQTQRMEDAPEGLQRDEFLGLQISLPLPLWNDRRGLLAEARAAARRRQLEAEALRQTAKAEVAGAAQEMEVHAKLVASLDKLLLPLASRVEEQLQAARSTGQLGVAEVLRARSQRLGFQRQRLDALRDYHLARVRLATAAGAGPTLPTVKPRAAK